MTPMNQLIIYMIFKRITEELMSTINLNLQKTSMKITIQKLNLRILKLKAIDKAPLQYNLKIMPLSNFLLYQLESKKKIPIQRKNHILIIVNKKSENLLNLINSLQKRKGKNFSKKKKIVQRKIAKYQKTTIAYIKDRSFQNLILTLNKTILLKII